ncbi:unnamed protein product [Coregonus sp. 'balchen']|nr:unnamed protein product [Coregonus sp. 'balchen']
MSYHQGAEGGAITKERQKDGSPNKDLDETMDPDTKRGVVHVHKIKCPTPSCESTRTLESAGELSNVKRLRLHTASHMSMSDQSKQIHLERPLSPTPSYLSMKSDQSMAIPLVFKQRNLTQRKEPVEVPCDICSEVKAVKFCQTCTISYCETHIRQHYTIAALQRHTVVEVTGDLVQKLCQHDYSPLEVFCRTDQMPICSQCAETKHKGHDTISHEIKKTGREVAPVLPPPGDIQVLLLTSDSVSLSWSSPQGVKVKGTQTFRVTWVCDGETSSTRVKGVYHLKISSLQPGEKYQFSVATEGEDGRQSRWASGSVSTVVPPRDLKVDTISVLTVLTNGEQSEPVSTTICTRDT